MADTSIPDIPLEAPQEQLNPWAEQSDEFIDALESLYIQGNISGRLHFRGSWPLVAPHIFCPAMMKYDEDGAEDKEHRAQLEIEAEERRMVLVNVLDDVVKKSVYHGSLQPEHVARTIMALGRPIALHVYARDVVDDIIPPGPDEQIAEEETSEGGPEEDAQSEDPLAPELSGDVDELSPTPAADLPPIEDLKDDVQPIDVSPVDSAPVDVQPIDVQPIDAAPSPLEGGSGLNLGAKRNIVQVDFIYSEPVSYAALVAGAEQEASEEVEAVPQPSIEAPSAPPLQPAEAAVAVAPPVKNPLPLKMIFNYLAVGRTE